nr:isoprenylcysteine carboxylmethyltransferase family protein [Oharaeibacter diazotrophicus]
MTLRVFVPATDVFLGALPVLETDAVRAVGFVAMCAGLAVADHAHSYLADEWRSGTAARAADVLVTDGPYARSRNPIFTGVLIGQAGLFLAAPSLFTLACLAIGAAVILRQVGVEERTLAGRFGGRYAAYRARVPRWGAVGMAARGVTERR